MIQYFFPNNCTYFWRGYGMIGYRELFSDLPDLGASSLPKVDIFNSLLGLCVCVCVCVFRFPFLISFRLITHCFVVCLMILICFLIPTRVREG